MEQCQGFSERSVSRQWPLGMLVYSPVVLWYVQHRVVGAWVQRPLC